MSAERVPNPAEWDDGDEDADVGPYLGNVARKSPRQGKTAVLVYDRGLWTKPKRPATAKQLKFAMAISRELDIKLPDERTRQSLFLFIRDNRPKYDNLMHNRHVESIAYHSDDPDPIDPDEDALMMEAYGLDPYTGGFADNC